MKTILITGAAGLIGSESVRFFADKGIKIIGIDNDMRKYFFGEEASTELAGTVVRGADGGKGEYGDGGGTEQGQGGLAQALDLPVPVVPLELPSYQKKENWGAAETFYRIVRTMTSSALPARNR